VGLGVGLFVVGEFLPHFSLFFWFLSQNWVTFFDFSLKLHCYIAYKLVPPREKGKKKGGGGSFFQSFDKDKL
jgi:hypothetical protein